MNLVEQGFTLIPDFISEADNSAILEALRHLPECDNAAGIRSIDRKIPSIHSYVNSAAFTAPIQHLLAPGAKLVRAILFNKTPTANWYVTWHQDKTVALSRFFADYGWRAWSL